MDNRGPPFFEGPLSFYLMMQLLLGKWQGAIIFKTNWLDNSDYLSHCL
jgi:hypothetical protein